MRYYTILLFGFLMGGFAANPLNAQNTNKQTAQNETIVLRSQLKKALQRDDKKRGAVLTDSLRALNSTTQTALLWDERWMVYHWTERHTLLLEEVKKYDWAKRTLEEYVAHVPSDSLFEIADQIMYARSNEYPAVLQDLGLKPEDQEFVLLHLQYLLRNNTENEQTIRAEFLTRYPATTYKAFIEAFMELPPKPRKLWVAAEGAFLQNNWQPDLDRQLSTGWGGYFSILFLKNRWCTGVHYGISQQKNLRDIFGGYEVFEKGARSEMNYYGFSTTYGLFDRPSMRVGPFFNLGVTHFTALSPEDDDLVGIYGDYDYFTVQTGMGISFDLKMKRRTHNPKGLLPPTYKGLRVRAGYNYMNLGKKNSQLAGNVVFVTLGYQLAYTQ